MACQASVVAVGTVQAEAGNQVGRKALAAFDQAEAAAHVVKTSEKVVQAAQAIDLAVAAFQVVQALDPIVVVIQAFDLVEKALQVVPAFDQAEKAVQVVQAFDPIVVVIHAIQASDHLVGALMIGPIALVVTIDQVGSYVLVEVVIRAVMVVLLGSFVQVGASFQAALSSAVQEMSILTQVVALNRAVEDQVIYQVGLFVYVDLVGLASVLAVIPNQMVASY